jgi:hypothetical protein
MCSTSGSSTANTVRVFRGRGEESDNHSTAYYESDENKREWNENDISALTGRLGGADDVDLYATSPGSC